MIVIAEDGIDGTFSTEASTKSESVLPLDKSASLTKRTTSKASTLAQHHSELIQWREFRDLARASGSESAAIEMGKRFIEENASSPLIPATVVQLVGLAKQDKGKHAVSAFLAQRAIETKDKSLQALMQRKSCVALAYEGNVTAALRGLEDLIESSPTTRDSLCALADATGLYRASRSTHDLSQKYSFVRTESIREFKNRMRELARFLDNPTVSSEPESSPIPTSYALYQNYPNACDRNTEMRF
ncbi:MAG: hypothetical protein IPH10_10395 [bacterium]|nr:hypothetical protein [bacterium]